MTESGSAEWVRQPAEDSAAIVEIRVPEGVTLDATVRQSIDKLVEELQKLGEASNSQSQGLMCNQGNCRPMVSGECAWFVTCRVG